MVKGDYLFTSESVTEGHPDKVCDQVSDAVLDEILYKEIHEKGGRVDVARVACETFVTVGMVVVGGEITTGRYVDLHRLVRNTLKDIGYTDAKYGFDYKTCAVLNAIGRQSPDIAQGVNTGGAGDQGMMVGFAINETPELMPMPISLAHKLTKRLAYVRKKGILKYLGPDGKSQVTVEYKNRKPYKIKSVVVASQHTEDVLDPRNKNRMSKKAVNEIIEKVVRPVLPKYLCKKDPEYHINETGKFVIGGPQSDTGMTGRKIIVDTYGGMCAHGGGAFSGKDPTKVDRSAAYMTRYVAKNVVKAGLAEKCELHISYVIGKAEPLSITMNTYGTNKISEVEIKRLVNRHFDFRPRAIIEKLNLRRPVYKNTAAYGHFGREEEGFTWEKTDKAAILKREAGI